MFEFSIVLLLALLLYAAGPYAFMFVAGAMPERAAPEARTIPEALAQPVSQLSADGRMSDTEALSLIERSAGAGNKTRQVDILARSIARAEGRPLAKRHKREAAIVIEALYPNTLRR